MGADFGGYRIFNSGGNGIAGLMRVPEPSIPPHWQPYVYVEDVDATVARAGELGGSTVSDPMDVPEVGRIAILRDPRGPFRAPQAAARVVSDGQAGGDRVRLAGRRVRGSRRSRELRARRVDVEYDRGEDGNRFKLDELMQAEVQLLGRVTYEGFAAAWPSREGPFAEKLNNDPKVVVSTTLKDPEWQNTR